MKQQSQGNRRGAVFSVRLTEEERAAVEGLQLQHGGPRSLGAWVRWRALGGGVELPPPPRPALVEGPPVGERVILDLCGGCGAWSRPYREAGYRVELVTLPEHDVRTYVPPPSVWGVLGAPPCTEFSLARNGTARNGVVKAPRDFIVGMETVNACMRIVLQTRPRWWALENPVGRLGEFLGPPRDVWEPCDFGDPWTKRTALWGEFTIPARGPHVRPLGGGPFCSICDPERRETSWCSNAAHRAVTPAGFARAFFNANP